MLKFDEERQEYIFDKISDLNFLLMQNRITKSKTQVCISADEYQPIIRDVLLVIMEYGYLKKSLSQNSLPETVPCKGCGTPIFSSGRKIYCSNRCNQRCFRKKTANHKTGETI